MGTMALPTTPVLLGLAAVVFLLYTLRSWLYPKPLPGIPFNPESARRFLGDMPNLVATLKDMEEFSEGLFTVSTQNLGTPIAQVLFPSRFSKPIVILEDAREIEDIVMRRNKEFDRAPMAVDLFGPMFPHSTLAMYASPELKATKRLWADCMSPEFLRKAVAPSMYKAAAELVDLWRLKSETVYKNQQPFSVLDDFKNAALDAIWVAVVGDYPGMSRYEMAKLKNPGAKIPEPPSAFLRDEVNYISDTISKSSNTPSPKWAQIVRTWTPRYRQFRSKIMAEMTRLMMNAMERYSALDMDKLEVDDADTCMTDLVLRRLVLEAKKENRPPIDPAKDKRILNEMIIMLVGVSPPLFHFSTRPIYTSTLTNPPLAKQGHDSTANTLTWFSRFMALPENQPVQSQLRSALQAAFPPEKGLPAVNQIIQADIPYLDGVIEEAFRLSGTAKGNLRQALVDTTVLGCHIPKGTEIFMNYHYTRSPRIPAEENKRSETSQKASLTKAKQQTGQTALAPGGDPAANLGQFEPRRWLVRDEKTGEERFNAYAIPAIAFGGGYRGCSGKRLAVMEFRIFVVLLVLSFEFLELPEEMSSLEAIEKIFREPKKPFVRVRAV